jgi:uncharacterized membrane protein YkvA (DUF1232 family)
MDPVMLKSTTMKTSRNLRHATHLFNNRKTLFQMLRDVFRGKYKMSFLTHLYLILGLIYIVSPLDFDWIPVIGWIDDGFVFYLLVKRLQNETQRYNRAKAMDRKLSQNL